MPRSPTTSEAWPWPRGRGLHALPPREAAQLERPIPQRVLRTPTLRVRPRWRGLSRRRTQVLIELAPETRSTASTRSIGLPASEFMARYTRQAPRTHIVCHFVIRHVTQ